MSIEAKYPSSQSIPTALSERFCFGAAAFMLVTVVGSVIAIGFQGASSADQMRMILGAAPSILVLIGVALFFRVRRTRRVRARAEFLASLRASNHG
ncbi:hypothetical protein [Sphingomonas sp.]|uniref:hypothetical protein n=1 Tax=Sphingomonas sp. TaxID=28214 RepID=UPI003BAB89E9